VVCLCEDDAAADELMNWPLPWLATKTDAANLNFASLIELPGATSAFHLISTQSLSLYELYYVVRALLRSLTTALGFAMLWPPLRLIGCFSTCSA
jgi:hypothetical protein